MRHALERGEVRLPYVRTPVCELLRIEEPIVRAPIGTAAGPRLAAAVSNAGALGMVALSWVADVSGVIGETSALTGRPFGGNLVLAWDQHRRLDQALEAGLRIVSLTWGDARATIRSDPAGAGDSAGTLAPPFVRNK
jgi:NAD(P)H-dependent flavin oxidoreductase YrpB (nitropropane dioxygenase family)